MMNELLIKESGDFISKSGTWGLNEFVVFFMIFFVLCGCLFVYFGAKQNEKTTRMLLQISEKTNETITNNTLAINTLMSYVKGQNKGLFYKIDELSKDIEVLKNNAIHSKNFITRLENLLNEINDIKHILKRKDA